MFPAPQGQHPCDQGPVTTRTLTSTQCRHSRRGHRLSQSISPFRRRPWPRCRRKCPLPCAPRSARGRRRDLRSQSPDEAPSAARLRGRPTGRLPGGSRVMSTLSLCCSWWQPTSRPRMRPSQRRGAQGDPGVAGSSVAGRGCKSPRKHLLPHHREGQSPQAPQTALGWGLRGRSPARQTSRADSGGGSWGPLRGETPRDACRTSAGGAFSVRGGLLPRGQLGAWGPAPPGIRGLWATTSPQRLPGN